MESESAPSLSSHTRPPGFRRGRQAGALQKGQHTSTSEPGNVASVKAGSETGVAVLQPSELWFPRRNEDACPGWSSFEGGARQRVP